MFSIKSETSFKQPYGNFASRQNEGPPETSPAVRGVREAVTLLSLSAQMWFLKTFFVVVRNTLNWFWQRAAGVLQGWHRSQEKAVAEAADLSFSVGIRACPAWWVAGVLPGSSAPWPRTRLAARPLLKAEVTRKPKWVFFSGRVGNSELCYL